MTVSPFWRNGLRSHSSCESCTNLALLAEGWWGPAPRALPPCSILTAGCYARSIFCTGLLREWHGTHSQLLPTPVTAASAAEQRTECLSGVISCLSLWHFWKNIEGTWCSGELPCFPETGRHQVDRLQERISQEAGLFSLTRYSFTATTTPPFCVKYTFLGLTKGFCESKSSRGGCNVRDGRFKGFHFFLAGDLIVFECSLESASPPQGETEMCPKAAQGPWWVFILIA